MLRLLFFSLLTLCSFGLQSESVIIDDVKDLKTFYHAIKAANPEKESTLIIFDIDDTLLEPVNFVGSSKWYNLQRGRNVYDIDGHKVTIQDKDKFNCIFSTMGTLFELNSTKPTQQNTAQIVNQLSPYNLMILTARTYGFRSATERELRKNGIDFQSKHLMDEGTGLEFILDENVPAAKVTYKNGIVMSSGRNKGLVLKTILEKVNKSFKHIYFIDDSRKNVDNMAMAWTDSETKVNIFHYTKVDTTISKEEVEQSIMAKEMFDSFLKVTYPDRYEDFKNGQCNY